MKIKLRQENTIAALTGLTLMTACATYKSHDHEVSHYLLKDSVVNDISKKFHLKSTDSLNLRLIEITAELIDSFPELKLHMLELSHEKRNSVIYNDSTKQEFTREENDSIHQLNINSRDSGNKTKFAMLFSVGIIIITIIALKLFKS